MGRGSGMAGSTQAGAQPRSAKPTRAISGAAGAPSYVADGPNATVFRARDKHYFRAETKLDVEIPAVRIEGQTSYPGVVPSDRIRFASAIWKHLVRDGRALSSEELRDRLHAEDGITRDDVGGSSDKRLGDSELRRELRELSHRAMLPLVNRAGHGEDAGYALAQSREEIQTYADRQRHRAEEIEAAAAGMEGSTWLEQGRPPCCSEHERLTSELLGQLGSSDEPLTSGDLCDLLDGQGLTTSDWTGRAHEGVRIEPAKLRSVIHHLRERGVPITGNSQGYALAASQDGANRSAARMRERAGEIRERVRLAEATGAFWFPQTPDEQIMRRHGTGKVWEKPHSASWRQSQKAQEDARRRSNERTRSRRQEQRERHQDMAQTRMADLEADYQRDWPLYSQGQRHRLSRLQRQRVEEYRAARTFATSGKLPSPSKRRHWAWAPVSEASRASRTSEARTNGEIVVPF